MKVFSPMMNRDPRGRLFVESVICVLRPMRLSTMRFPHSILQSPTMIVFSISAPLITLLSPIDVYGPM
jgi:hypothetical protein